MKPAFSIPTMKQIARLKPNGFSVVSTFSGGGGSCLGYRMAGYRVLWANEFIEEARNTYAANHPSSILDGRDIREVTAKDILDATGLKKRQLDLFDGSPPCASFSQSGSKSKGWGQVKQYSDSKQRTDDLFFEYARLLEGLQPKVFVAENVSGLVRGHAIGYFKRILERLAQCGYRVESRLLDAQWLGVPQRRERMIFVGVRSDLKHDPVFPSPFPYQYTIAELFPYIRFIRSSGKADNWRSPIQPALTVVQSDATRKLTARMSSGGWVKADEGGERLQVRKYTIEELKTICSFPADFQLTGNFAQQWERLGRSVPPLMMRAISSTIAEQILSAL